MRIIKSGDAPDELLEDCKRSTEELFMILLDCSEHERADVLLTSILNAMCVLATACLDEKESKEFAVQAAEMLPQQIDILLQKRKDMKEIVDKLFE